MAQAVEIAIRHTEPRVDLFTVIAARVAQRVHALGADFRLALSNQSVGDVDVAVLDDDVGGAVTPECVPRPHVFAAE